MPKIPKLELGSPRIGRLAAAGTTLEIPITVTNRNSYPLPIQSFSGALLIAGARVGDFSSGEIGQLDAKGARQISVPVTVHFAEAARAAALRREATEWVLSGEVSSGGVSIPFRHSQVVKFQP